VKKRILALAMAGLVALSGCAPAAEEPDFAPAEAERLTVYTSHKAEVYWPIIKEFEERTGIWVDVVEGGTNEILEQIAAEADAPKADVMFGGGVESLASQAEYFTPYVCAEWDSIDPQFQVPDGLWTPFSSLPVVLIYNTKLVDPGQLTGWGDLLSPELKGKIAFADPAVSGSSFTALATMILALGGDREGVSSALAENLEGGQVDGSGAVLTAVADGSAWVGVTLEETALKRIAAGDDIAMVYPAEGTSSVPDAGALVKGAPHEENAKKFLDFIAGADVQALVAGQFRRRSVRTDVEVLDLPPLGELALVEYDIAWASENRDALLMTWAFYLDGGETA